MAVEMTRTPIIFRRGIQQYANLGKPNLRLLDNSKIISSKIAFQASMEKAMLSQQYWNELLEKLRKGGGGGGGGSSFDRVTVSMQLMNFLSDKTIQAMLRNFTDEILNINNVFGQIQNTNQNPLANVIQRIGSIVFLGLTNAILLIARIDTPMGRLYAVVTQAISSFALAFAFQLNKLKEILEEDLKEFIKKLDVLYVFVEMKKEIVNVVEWLKSAALLHIEGLLKKSSALN